MEKDDKIEILSKAFAAWEHLGGLEREALLVHTASVRYPKGAHLHSGENDCVGAMILVSGRIRAYLLSEEGREVTLYRLGPGDMCVLSASCVLSAITFDVYVDAEEDTEVLIVSSSFFASLAKKNIYVECFIYKLATERFSDVMWAMQQLLFMKMDKRLAIFLWDEYLKAGEGVISVTHEQAARYLGTAREVVTRMLKFFVSEGIVRLSRGGVQILDVKKLKELTR